MSKRYVPKHGEHLITTDGRVVMAIEADCCEGCDFQVSSQVNWCKLDASLPDAECTTTDIVSETDVIFIEVKDE